MSSADRGKKWGDCAIKQFSAFGSASDPFHFELKWRTMLGRQSLEYSAEASSRHESPCTLLRSEALPKRHDFNCTF